MNHKYRLRLYVVLVSSALLSGCIGVMYRQDNQQEYDRPSLQPSKGEVSRQNANPGQYTRYTQQDVLKLWGKPSAKDVLPDGHEVWTYSHGLSWHGYMPIVVIVPIPLMVPAGTTKTTLEFDGQNLVKATYFDFGMRMHGCGLLPVFEGFSFTCY